MVMQSGIAVVRLGLDQSRPRAVAETPADRRDNCRMERQQLSDRRAQV